ncbi:MAG: metallophosphoesterase [Ruminiclostridium sp.]|nr:metallophosphoesterase [Ruminiclostridium sp.]
MKRKKWVMLGCALAVLLGIACNLSLKTVFYDIETDKLDAQIKIAFLSDVHNSRFGKGQSGIIDEIEAYGADIVVFGGDLFDEYNKEDNSWALVDALAQKYPCFYAVGNHEFKTRKVTEYKEKMSERGVRVLVDETEVIEINGQQIRICGTENVWDENAVSELDDKYSVLIHHYPDDFPELSVKGFDLILAGHAHGGQWRIPGILNGLYAPDQGLFPEYAGGYYCENGTEMIVSRGMWKHYGIIYIPRVFNRPELVFVTLN